MKDSRLLYDTFNIYYNRGIEALKEKNYELANITILTDNKNTDKIVEEILGVI